jgi:hypothetical protein
MPNRVTKTAPERIWVQVSDDAQDCREPFPEPNEGMTWCGDSVLACEVEYVRADLAAAAIKKATGRKYSITDVDAVINAT